MGEKPIPTEAAKPRVHAFAEEVARQLGVGVGHPLEPVVSRLGGTIRYHSPFATANNAPPSIEVEHSRSFVIHLPSTTSPQRDRFTIAHELGHLFLHYPMVLKEKPGARMVATRWVDPSDPKQQRAEWEANWFAAAFLMPTEAFTAAWKSMSGNLSAVASLFEVSEQAAEIRAKSLGSQL